MKRYIKSAVNKFEDESYSDQLGILETTHSAARMKRAIDYAYSNLTEYQWVKVLEAIAKNPNAPEDVLVQMAKDSEDFYRIQYFITKNPNTPESLRLYIMNSVDVFANISTRIALAYTGDFCDRDKELMKNIVQDVCKKFNLDVKRVDVCDEFSCCTVYLSCSYISSDHTVSEVASCITAMMYKEFDCKIFVATTCVDSDKFSDLDCHEIDMQG